MQMKQLAYFVRPSRIAALLLLLLLWGPQTALAGLMLYPTRVVLENKARSSQVELINNGDMPETYRIVIVNRRMTETGDLVSANEPQDGEQFATDMLRYSPRQVTLPPGKSQTVRIMVRKPAGLASGEYRSHLQFNRVADAEGEANLENLAKPEKGDISIVLQVLVGASIPVIVRHGETRVTSTLTDLALEPGKDNEQFLSFTIKRDGTRSLYGDLIATFTPAGASPLEVGKVSGVAVYVPNALRKSKLPVKLPEGVPLKKGTLTLRYLDRPEAGGKVMAEAKLAVP
jgi:P pilus assembly chaperone PapD